MHEEQLILIFADYALDFVHPRNLVKSGARFAKTSYSIWATNELLSYILENNTVDPLVSIERFAARMKDYSTMSAKNREMFIVAKEIAEDFRDMFRAMK